MKTQKELLEILVAETGLKKSEVEAVLNSLEKNLTEDLVETGSTKFLKFGKIEIVKRAAREGRNPRTKEIIQIPEKLAPRFIASKFLKDKAVESKLPDNNKEEQNQ